MCFCAFFLGDHIQGAFNISQTPICDQQQSLDGSFSNASQTKLAMLAKTEEQSQNGVADNSSQVHFLPVPAETAGDCSEIRKMQGLAVYFLHNKDRSRSYYNLDVRNANGSQKRVRSRDLPWGMKQVSAFLFQFILFLIIKIAA